MITGGKQPEIRTDHHPEEDKPCSPPIEEVLIKSTYQSAVLGFPPVPTSAWMHGLSSKPNAADTHTGVFWLGRVPARLGQIDTGDQDQTGWGIMITEGYELKPLLCIISVVVVIAAFVFASPNVLLTIGTGLFPVRTD
jgi:hypothetical protein